MKLKEHTFDYKTGSQRQQVTAYHARDDNDWWEVVPVSTETGAIRYGSTLKLRHEATGKLLYSILGFESSATMQQEVCCYIPVPYNVTLVYV
jgi:dolichyl-phosphate-mannose--protein O-mannosyl transferase